MATFFVNNIDENTRLGIWKITEQPQNIFDKYIIKPHEKIQFEKINNQSRKTEWICTRLLLSNLTSINTSIYYNNFGKPELNTGDYKISVSHSKKFVAILLSKNKTPGIDIEQITDRPQKIKHKFLTTNEQQWCTTNFELTTAWSAKETIYKIFGPGLDFKNIVLDQFYTNKTQFTFNANIVNYEQPKIKVSAMIIENNILTYSLATT